MSEPDHIASRRHAIDVLRAVAMLLGVVLHAVIAYMPTRVPHLLWPVREPGGAWFDVAFWWIHGFRVELFFWISGLLAASSIARNGPGAFVAQRFVRLGVPLAAGTLLVVGGLMYPVWAIGWIRTGSATLMQVLHVRFDHETQQDLYGVAHLWFIEYLLCYSCMLGLWRRFVPARPRESGLGVAVPLAILFAFTIAWRRADPRSLLEFHNWFLPRSSEFLHHLVFFIAGVLCAGSATTLARMAKWWWVFLIAAQCVTPWYLDAVGSWREGSELASACVSAVYSWASVLGWVGAAMAGATRTWPLVRFLAPRAYWIYVVHPPLVGAVQIALYGSAMPASIKAIFAAFAAVLVASWLHSPFVRCIELVRGAAKGPSREAM